MVDMDSCPEPGERTHRTRRRSDCEGFTSDCRVQKDIDHLLDEVRSSSRARYLDIFERA